VIDGETVGEKLYYEALRCEIAKAQPARQESERQPLLVDLDSPEASELELDARDLGY
jgi:hypothetical protein